MATRAVNEAVVVYRKLVLADYDMEARNTQLNRMVEGLNDDEIKDYVRMTQEIELAVHNFNSETPRPVFRAALNAAGKDQS